MNPYVVTFALVVSIANFVMIISIILLRLTLTRRLKAKLRETNDLFYDTGTWDLGLFNTALFAIACAVPQVKKFKNHKNFVSENIDVRSFATGFEVFWAYACVVSTSLIMLAILIYYPTDYFGLIDWNTANLP